MPVPPPSEPDPLPEPESLPDPDPDPDPDPEPLPSDPDPEPFPESLPDPDPLSDPPPSPLLLPLPDPLPEPVDSLPPPSFPPLSSLPSSLPPRPAACSRPLRAWWPARLPAPSRRDSAKVWPEFLSASTPASAPVLALRPTSKPFCAPKCMFMPCAMASEIIASSAETAGSLTVSTIASTSASRASFRMRRTISRVAWVAAAAPISERPNVKGAAA